MWLPKSNKNTTPDDLQLLKITFKVATIISERDATSDTHKWLLKNAIRALSLPIGTPAMQPKQAHSSGLLTPTKTTKPLDIWIIGDATHINTAPLKKAFWTDPYCTLLKLEGPLWDTYRKADQAAGYQNVEGTLAATDGSFQKNAGEDGGHLAGAGVTYRPTDNIPDEKERIQCDVSSLVPEIHAVCMALKTAPKDKKLTILTDSATVMWITIALNQELFWRNLEIHGQIQAIHRLATHLDSRTAETTLVKVASHRGCFMNEIADTLAGEAATDLEEIQQEYETRYDKDIPIITIPTPDPQAAAEQDPLDDKEDAPTITPLNILLTATIPQALMARRQYKYLRIDPTKTYIALRDPNSGRNHLGAALKNMSEKATRRAVQIITHNFPSQARLFVWGKEKSPTCPFCQHEAETTAHFSQSCPKFSDARTKAHDTIWGTTWSEILKHKGKNWIATHDTTMDNTDLHHDPSMGNLRPDGIMCNTTTGEIIIFEFTRTSGYTAHDTREAEEKKTKKYKKLTRSIDRLNRTKYPRGARLCVITCTFTGAIDATACKEKLEPIIDPKKTKGTHKIIQTLVQTTLEAFSDMADTRNAARASLDTP